MAGPLGIYTHPGKEGRTRERQSLLCAKAETPFVSTRFLSKVTASLIAKTAPTYQ